MMSGIVHQARGRDKTYGRPKLSQINLNIIYIWFNLRNNKFTNFLNVLLIVDNTL